MKTKISVFVEYSKTKKTKTSRYFFETELGTCALEDREHGNYRFHQSDRDWREIKMKDVPSRILDEFRPLIEKCFPVRDGLEAIEVTVFENKKTYPEFDWVEVDRWVQKV